MVPLINDVFHGLPLDGRDLSLTPGHTTGILNCPAIDRRLAACEFRRGFHCTCSSVTNSPRSKIFASGEAKRRVPANTEI